MRFYTAGNDAAEFEHRDLVAMILAIELYTESAAAILDKIPDGNRSPGILDTNGNPRQFLDRDQAKNETWDAEFDYQIHHVVDSWGVPISYFAQRDYDPDGDPEETESHNAPGWNQASTEMIHLNGKRPVIMSYGPSGPEQFTRSVQTETDGGVFLAADWVDNQRIDHPYHADNIYANPALKEKLTEGITVRP